MNKTGSKNSQRDKKGKTDKNNCKEDDKDREQ